MLSEFPPHLYYVAPINATWKWGIGVNAPFGLVTEWEDPDQFAGRFLSTRAALEAVDVNPTIGWQITPTFGLGFGAIARFSAVELERNAGAINPFTQQVADIAHVELESDMDNGFGFNLGMLHKATPAFSWGLSYRSKIEVDYGGDARLSQIFSGNPVFDTIIGGRLPFDQDLPIETSIEFPDMASLGLAYALSDRLLVEADVNWTGWSSFDEVEILPQNAAGEIVFTPDDARHPRALGRRDELPDRRALGAAQRPVALRLRLRRDAAARVRGEPAAARRRPQRLHRRLRPRERPGPQVGRRADVPRLRRA